MHPYVATCLNYLGRLLVTQRKYAEAEARYQEALNIRIQAWTVHPRVAQTLNDLAELYVLQGRYSDAAPLYSNVLVIYEQTLPTNHPLVAKILANYHEVRKRLEADAQVENLEKDSSSMLHKNERTDG